MNAIETLNRVNFYVDVTRSARFSYLEINSAVNDAMFEFIDKKIGDVEHRSPENFQWVQTIRDSLYTLISSNIPTITVGTAITSRYRQILPSSVDFPANYSDLISVRCIIDGIYCYARPTSYNELWPLFEDSFKYPSNVKPYYVEDASGVIVYRANEGTMTAVALEYLKVPATFSVGQESQLINPGGAVLTNGLSYIAVEVSVQNAVTRQIGTQFTAVGTSLTSGQVILASNTTPIELPSKTHEEIAQMAAYRLLGVTSNLVQSQAIDGLK